MKTSILCLQDQNKIILIANYSTQRVLIGSDHRYSFGLAIHPLVRIHNCCADILNRATGAITAKIAIQKASTSVHHMTLRTLRFAVEQLLPKARVSRGFYICADSLQLPQVMYHCVKLLNSQIIETRHGRSRNSFLHYTNQVGIGK